MAQKKKIHKTKDGENVLRLEVAKVVLALLRLEVAEVVLAQRNLVENQYQQNSEVLCTFNLNKSCAYLWNVEPSMLMVLKAYNTKFDGVITFTGQNDSLLEIEGKGSLTLPINKQKWHVNL